MPQAIAIFDIDGVIRDVSGSYRRAIADTVEDFTQGKYHPSPIDIDNLKSEGMWNNDWEATQELTYRYLESEGVARNGQIDYSALVNYFQSRYQGTDSNWNGYICQEKLLISASYLDNLTACGIYWGFFSGAPRDEANYVLQKRLGLKNAVLTAMEDAPSKPDPTGLFATITEIEKRYNLSGLPVIYAGDTVADIYTIVRAKSQHPDRSWVAVGILPPHILEDSDRTSDYRAKLIEAGADLVFDSLEQLTAKEILAAI